MIKKRLKNLTKIGTLIAARQLYFLGRNLYHLKQQPYLTLKRLRDKGDKSQFFLISVVVLAPVWIYVMARIAYDLVKFGRLVWVTGNVFVGMAIFQIVTLGYLIYWTLIVLRREK